MSHDAGPAMPYPTLGMSKKSRVIFRADASASIGAGHVSRCSVLADALAAVGWNCAFAVNATTKAFFQDRGLGEHEILVLDDDAAGEVRSMKERWPVGCDYLVVDHYDRDAEYENNCRPWARAILTIDDLAERPHGGEILLNQNLGLAVADYAALTNESCRVLVGPVYALLRPQFAAARPAALERRKKRHKIERILVSLGATDPGNVTCRVIDALHESGIDVAIDVVLGAGAPHLDVVRERLAAKLPRATLHRGVADMATLMVSADLAIGAAGSSSWERCCLALPSLLIVTADNQRFVSTALDDAGAARLLGRAEDLTTAGIADAVTWLATNAEVRVSMAEQAAKLCDGRGHERIVLALSAPRHGLWLRLASHDDSQLIFDWQCHPETRRFARNPAAPTRDEHDGWMDRMCSDANVMLMLVMDGDEPVGVLRLDAVDGPAVREVSIYVAPERYGQGIASAALKLARTIYPSWTFLAEVRAHNRASHALFRTAGYRKLSEMQYICDPMAGLS